MSEPVETGTTPNNDNNDTVTNEEVTNNTNKRPAEDKEDTDRRELKVVKLDKEQAKKEPTPEEMPKNEEPTQEETSNAEENKEEKSDETPKTSETEPDEKPDTDSMNDNAPIINLAQGAHPPPPGLHLLTDTQQQQLLQSYVQTQGQDLANLTASSLAQAMVSPLSVPTLASNLLQQLHQSGNIITALPGPPPQLPHQMPIQHNPAPLSDDAQGANKRANSRSLTNDEKRQRRLLRNRVAAKECRKKKKKHIQDMEEKIVQLEEENAKLAKEVEELKKQLSLGVKTENDNHTPPVPEEPVNQSETLLLTNSQ